MGSRDPTAQLLVFISKGGLHAGVTPYLLPTAATSWYEEFRRLYDMVPCVEVQTLKEHTDQVLHLSFSHSGYQFASCSKDCTVKVRVPLSCSGTQWEEKSLGRKAERVRSALEA